MKCPNCDSSMGFDKASQSWFCKGTGCGTYLDAQNIPFIVAERNRLAAENEKLRTALKSPTSEGAE